MMEKQIKENGGSSLKAHIQRAEISNQLMANKTLTRREKTCSMYSMSSSLPLRHTQLHTQGT